MTMAHQPLAAVFGLSVSVAAKEGCDLGLDGLRQQRPRTLAQNFGERVGELCWLDQLDGIILGHGVSLLWWRSGGSNTPTIRRLNPSRRHQLPRIPRASSSALCSDPQGSAQVRSATERMTEVSAPASTPVLAGSIPKRAALPA